MKFVLVMLITLGVLRMPAFAEAGSGHTSSSGHTGESGAKAGSPSGKRGDEASREAPRAINAAGTVKEKAASSDLAKPNLSGVAYMEVDEVVNGATTFKAIVGPALSEKIYEQESSIKISCAVGLCGHH